MLSIGRKGSIPIGLLICFLLSTCMLSLGCGGSKGNDGPLGGVQVPQAEKDYQANMEAYMKNQKGKKK